MASAVSSSSSSAAAVAAPPPVRTFSSSLHPRRCYTMAMVRVHDDDDNTTTNNNNGGGGAALFAALERVFDEARPTPPATPPTTPPASQPFTRHFALLDAALLVSPFVVRTACEACVARCESGALRSAHAHAELPAMLGAVGNFARAHSTFSGAAPGVRVAVLVCFDVDERRRDALAATVARHSLGAPLDAAAPRDFARHCDRQRVRAHYRLDDNNDSSISVDDDTADDANVADSGALSSLERAVLNAVHTAQSNV